MEEDWESGSWLGFDNEIPLRQHNLIRSVAYELLKTNTATWKAAEYKAAEQWLNYYESTSEAVNLEKVRGYLEAFEHYCEVEDWEKASQIISSSVSSGYELHKQLEIWGYHQVQITLYNRLLERLGTAVEFELLKGLGNAYRFLSDFDQAIKYYEKASALAKESDNRRAEGESLQNLGLVYAHLGDYDQARKYYNRSLSIACSISYKELEGRVLGSLGIVYYTLREYDQALECHRNHLEIARYTKDSLSEARALLSLGITYHLMRKYDQAIEFYQQSLDLSRSLGDLHGEGAVLNSMARTLIKLKRFSEALPLLTKAIAIFTETGNFDAKKIALTNLKEIDRI